MQVSVPDHIERGSVADVAVHATPAQADVSIFHVDVLDPQGNHILYYSGNFIARQGGGVHSIPFAANDVPGKWTVIVRDLMSGQSVQQTVNVE